MMNTALLTLFAALAVEASTKIAVLEFGKAGTVRRAQAKNAETSVEGVLSFWSALHPSGSSSGKVQRPGMTVVPDLFRKPDSGVVIGISGSGVDLDTLEGFSALFTIEESVGFLEVGGGRCTALMSNVPEWEDVPVESLTKSALSQGVKKGLSGVKTVVDSESIHAVDQQLSNLVGEFKKLAESKGETIVVHFVVEEDESVSRRRRLSRDLEEEQGDNAENAEDDKEYNGYYGYGYYNDNGEWVTPYKTMFQIQFFNVVLWTSLGLVLAISYSIFLMIYMPLEPDTLLFGESAKLVGDE
jgi:hypothetical protein